MLLEQDKNVVIIAHPRSGSYWFQSLFKQFFALETFNLTDWDIDRIENNRFHIRNSGKKAALDSVSEHEAYLERLLWLGKVPENKTIKVLTYQFQHSYNRQYNQDIFDYVNNMDSKVYWIKRRDRLASIHSYLVAKTLFAWIGKIEATEIEVNLDHLPFMEYALSYDKDQYVMDNIHHDIEHVVYEDLLEDESVKNLMTFMPRQDSKKVLIKNWDEVLDNLSDGFKREIGIK